jgi:hypothetical protein
MSSQSDDKRHVTFKVNQPEVPTKSQTTPRPLSHQQRNQSNNSLQSAGSYTNRSTSAIQNKHALEPELRPLSFSPTRNGTSPLYNSLYSNAAPSSRHRFDEPLEDEQQVKQNSRDPVLGEQPHSNSHNAHHNHYNHFHQHLMI